MMHWTVTRTWHNVVARTAAEAIEESRNWEHTGIEAHVDGRPDIEMMIEAATGIAIPQNPDGTTDWPTYAARLRDVIVTGEVPPS